MPEGPARNFFKEFRRGPHGILQNPALVSHQLKQRDRWSLYRSLTSLIGIFIDGWWTADDPSSTVLSFTPRLIMYVQEQPRYSSCSCPAGKGASHLPVGDGPASRVVKSQSARTSASASVGRNVGPPKVIGLGTRVEAVIILTPPGTNCLR